MRAPDPDPTTETVDIPARIPRERIGELNALLEGYEGMAVLRTLDPVRGLVRIHVAAGCLETARRLLASLETELDLRLLAPDLPEA